jgi:hypothetical protein
MSDLVEKVGAPFSFVERNDLTPVCPYCEAALPEVFTRGKGITIAPPGRTVVYFCPNCLKVLGIAQGRRPS